MRRSKETLLLAALAVVAVLMVAGSRAQPVDYRTHSLGLPQFAAVKPQAQQQEQEAPSLVETRAAAEVGTTTTTTTTATATAGSRTGTKERAETRRVAREQQEELARMDAALLETEEDVGGVLKSLTALPPQDRVVAHMAQSFLLGLVADAYVPAAPSLLEEEEEAEDLQMNFEPPTTTTTSSRDAGSIPAPSLETSETLMKMPSSFDPLKMEEEPPLSLIELAARVGDGDRALAASEAEFIGNLLKKGGAIIKKGAKAVVNGVKSVVNFGKKMLGLEKKKEPTFRQEPAQKQQGEREPTREDIEDCFGCKMVWSQVEMDVGDARYAEDVQASFEYNCMDAQKSNIFYVSCEDMYDDIYAMTSDYMSSKYEVDQICERSKMCLKSMTDTSNTQNQAADTKEARKNKVKKRTTKK